MRPLLTANFEIGSVTDDGFGSTDTVLNFEEFYGSYHDDIVSFRMTSIAATCLCMVMTIEPINTRDHQ